MGEDEVGRIILNILIIWIPRSRLQFTGVAMTVFSEVTTSEESRRENRGPL